ncbi:hypothetical protein GOB94_11830 [Granulicella sp. 5B5]|uniref:hypothetical protein n=1 Tax=Granulicella sp. 5B5 TaxID=1617967 RepID=UPI0015F43F6C|nr:hypothetical protein [Granulicella sp. 5B5]QMV19293.1 hypothetical protein GOB94_11830 [Granulicella sp. 5B5]
METMRHPAAYLLLAIFLPLAAHAEKARHPAPPQPAETYPMHQTNDHVTIAAEPGDTKETRPNTRLDYYSHDMLPIRVIVTNDSNNPLTLDDARIHFISAANDNIPAATLDDLQRRMFTLKSATGKKIPLPLGIPIPITTGKQNVDKKITQDDDDFGFQTTTVQPHTTVAGYLYYDIQGLDRPALAHATLELRKVRFQGGDYLESFEIPLHPTEQPTATK